MRTGRPEAGTSITSCPSSATAGSRKSYWTYGYSPVFDDDGRIGGTLVVCTETTSR